MEPNDSGIGPGRFIALHQSLFLNEAIEKLKTHLRLPHLRLALAVNDKKGEKESNIKFSLIYFFYEYLFVFKRFIRIA